DCRDIEVDRIAKEPTHGTVRTNVDPAIEQRVKRIDANEVRTERARPLRQGGEILDIADAPVPRAADGVQVCNQPKRAAAAEQLGRSDGAFRHDDERLVRVPLSACGGEQETHRVIAERRQHWYRELKETLAHPCAAS